MNHPSNSEETVNPHEEFLAIPSQACEPLKQVTAQPPIEVARQKQSVSILAQLNAAMARSPKYIATAETAIDRLIIEQLAENHVLQVKTSASKNIRTTDRFLPSRN